MLIWMDAWSLAPMILLLAELQNREKHAVIRVASPIGSHQCQCAKLTIYEGRTGPQIHQRRSACCRL